MLAERKWIDFAMGEGRGVALGGWAEDRQKATALL